MEHSQRPSSFQSRRKRTLDWAGRTAVGEPGDVTFGRETFSPMEFRPNESCLKVLEYFTHIKLLFFTFSINIEVITEDVSQLNSTY
jgi:hypothetical protein